MSERKYGQKGYQDHGGKDHGGESRGRQGGGRGPGPRDQASGPRGRGLGKPTATVFRCAVCGTKSNVSDLTQEALCGKCKTPLHTCTHCRHFDSSAVNECREPVSERIAGKAKANTCEHFAPKATKEFAAEAPSTNDAKAAFDALFNL